MLRQFAALVFVAAPMLHAAGWTEYRSGPFRVVSNAGDRTARERLDEMEQIRWVLGGLLGKQDLDTVWPVNLVLFPNPREYGPHALSQPFVEGGSSLLSAGNAENPQPLDWRRELTRILIEDNAGRMPAAIETGLCDLFSTLQVAGTRVMLGAPLPAGVLDGERLRAWAKVQMLATRDEYSGKFRIYLNNLQQGGEADDLGTRNAFGITAAELERRAAAYLQAGKFIAVPVPGRALAPGRDFDEKSVSEADAAALLAELAAGGKSFPPESPRGLYAKNTKAALELAAKANPKWAEPHVRLAALEPDPKARIKELNAAATLEPRNAAYWQALAEAQTLADEFAGAAKSWALAERESVTEAGRERTHQARLDMEEKRTDFEIAERKRIAAEQAADLQRVKDQAAAEVHAAEDAANRAQGGLKSNQKPVAWWVDETGTPVEGLLTRVDCMASSFKLTIQKAGSKTSVVLLVRDPGKLSVRGAATNAQLEFDCGVQRPARKIQVVHDAKPDAKLGTAGDVRVVEFP
jgi:hypothetical protein